jgi:N-acetylmuramoyl-L-alanine amidase
MRSFGRRGAAVALLVAIAAPALQGQTDAEPLYREAVRREEALRREIDGRAAGAPAAPLLERARTLMQTYEDVARLFPKSGFGDDALWQGAMLAGEAYFEFGLEPDRTRALRLFKAIETRYPSSSLVKQVAAQSARLSAPRRPVGSVLKGVRREILPDALRITLELEREVPFYDERIEGPPRVFIDLTNTRAADALRDATLRFDDDVVRQVRVGRQQNTRTRVVLDLQGAARHSVYALYNPYRVVVDVERVAAAKTAASGRPAPPSENGHGGFSLSRQLGLGVARVVIDPGHGGHDPGAQVKGLGEAELTLDVALRLEKLLLKQPGVEVMLTRRSDAFVPLEERTAIANRAGADLFLSIHTNASADVRAAGIETYVLNFASNSAAEAVAARENAGSSRTMGELPDIVKAIALNNKIDESREFASFVQASLVAGLRRVNRQARSLGVKQAPFMVLIGATMPSVLVEVSFVTNRQEAALLRTPRYREQIAAALFAGIMDYQKALKKTQAMARQ